MQKPYIKIGSYNHPLQGVKHGDLPNDCWFNGKEAVASWPGVADEFVLIRDLTTGLGAYWSRQAAERIFNRDRKFKS